MANPRDRFWTTAEIAIVREHYPHGGIDACVPLLSKRSRSSIYQRAGKLKLRAPGQPALRQSWKPDADIDARIVWLHQRPMGRGAILEFAARISRPQWWVSKRARELGLKTPRFKESPWSEAELALLHETSHLSAKQARIRFVKAGFTRSETAIHVMRTLDPHRQTGGRAQRRKLLDPRKRVTRIHHHVPAANRAAQDPG
jgi:hypothetical protein